MGAADGRCEEWYDVDTAERGQLESSSGAGVSTSPDDKPHLPAPSLWPIGFAIGIACTLVGLVVSVPVLVVGALITVVFGFLWVYDLLRSHRPAVPATAEGVEEEHEPPAYDRSVFLSAATIGVGGLIGAVVTVPVLGFMVLPSFESADAEDVDLGPISNFPEGKFVIATYLENPDEGPVSRRTAYVRNNGSSSEGAPSFTILFSRCVHLGCPVQANGPFEGDPISYRAQRRPEVTLQPVLAQSFGCPCHGGQYDAEGRRTAGPPVRSMDRYEFSIRNGNLFVSKIFSVGEIEGAGANARMLRYDRAYPGVHVDGLEQWLYPLPVPGSS
jgi:menaquinol-cytochrome c reductase iron-sulfur subunit